MSKSCDEAMTPTLPYETDGEFASRKIADNRSKREMKIVGPMLKKKVFEESCNKPMTLKRPYETDDKFASREIVDEQPKQSG